jgi:profilin-like protein
MGEEEGSWDATIEEWLIAEGYCSAGALAQASDGAFYAAAPVAGEAGWAIVYADDHEELITQEDMSEKKMTINEATNLLAMVTHATFKAPPSGLWLGGTKYRVTQSDPALESGDYTFKYVMVNAPKKGVHILVTPGATPQIIAAFYDEEKGQSSGNCKKTAIAFAEYLAGIGY